MSRRLALVAVLVVVAAMSGAVSAERPPKIGYLVLESIREQPSRERKAFLDGLAEFGWVVGKSVNIVYRSAENEPEFLPAMCEDLLSEKVDVIVTVGGLPTLACLKATRAVPIVFLAVGDPVGYGIAESLARPGRNATGISLRLSELAAKRIELLTIAVPAAERVALLWDPRNRIGTAEMENAEAAAKKAGMRTTLMPVESQADLNRRFKQIEADRPDGLYVGFSPGMIPRNRTSIAQFALRHRVAVVSAWASMTDAGGLLSYAPNAAANFRRCAYFVDRILKGTRPGDLPIEQPRQIEFVVNLDTARRLGLTIPPSILLRADRVIE